MIIKSKESRFKNSTIVLPNVSSSNSISSNCQKAIPIKKINEFNTIFK